MAFTMKRNDTRPVIEAQLLMPDPVDPSTNIAVDLTAASSVKFLMKKDSTLKVTAAATVVNAATGLVRYTWAVGDTDTSGTYNVEWEVSWGSDKQTFPSDSYLNVVIMDDLG